MKKSIRKKRPHLFTGHVAHDQAYFAWLVQSGTKNFGRYSPEAITSRFTPVYEEMLSRKTQ